MYRHRAAVREDFETIARFPRDATELFYMYPRGTFPLTAGQLEEAAASRFHPTVVLDGDDVVGYANFYEINESDCWLGNVILAPSHRGKGAGRYLIETMAAIARSECNVRYFRLVCHNTNSRALLFYTKLGFKPFGVKPMKDHTGADIGGIQMEIELKDDTA